MFGTITQCFIKYVVKTCVLALVMIYETRHKNATKYLRVLSCVIYTIIDKYICIYYIVCKYKKLNVICMD